MQDKNLKGIINAAYIFELRGIRLYENLKDKDPIFAQILAIKNSGLMLLSGYESNEPVECYFDGLSNQSLENCLIKALNYEIELNAFYEMMTDKVEDENLRDICFRLWATSHNEYIAALKMRLYEELGTTRQINAADQEYKKEDDHDNDEQEHAYDQPKNNNFGFNGFNGFNQNAFAEMSKRVERIASGRGSQEDIVELLNSPHFSFFSGLAIGGMAGILINKMINKEDEKEDV
ncbi:aminotransferase [Campylobacter sp. RM16192]|uniref:aminotransferase n=1 Tax=Campylobacter sp. RM16192 TaxID=1660080 RepID=UPI0014515B92|nr:aminotransferase [Campylobacter sp. RM16192]QCD52761.1 hypothetical protein CDOMC_1149 [Campylobacter sp. RM16192]